MSAPSHPPASSPDTLCCEFSRSLDQCFAWSPPDLSVSSQSCPSIMPLSSSEISRLGLSRFESDSAPSSLFLAQQVASRETEWEYMSQRGVTRSPSTVIVAFDCYYGFYLTFNRFRGMTFGHRVLLLPGAYMSSLSPGSSVIRWIRSCPLINLDACNLIVPSNISLRRTVIYCPERRHHLFFSLPRLEIFLPDHPTI